MKKLLIISFDLIREGESEKSLAVSSILAYLKDDIRYGENFVVDHISINMWNLSKKIKAVELKTKLDTFDLHEYDYIAMSAYVWNEFLTNDLMTLIRIEYGYKGDFILGGYQISYSSSPEKEYPNAKYFISGYAEESVLDILVGNVRDRRVNSVVDFTKIPSPYLLKELPIEIGQKMVRLETKRGCPYKCSFCAHRDLTYNRVYKHQIDKIFNEIAFFNENKVGKINIVDPIFNAGREYLSVLEEFSRTGTSSQISVQARFETINGENGKKFLDFCERLDINLEFGLQTTIQSESNEINRKNKPEKIKAMMNMLNERQIKYEISLIYGLPTQTLDSFKSSIDFVFKNGCTNVTAFPLMLLKGTELHKKKDYYGFKERVNGEYDIPVVIESNTFTEKEWYSMKDLAESLSQGNNRI